MKRYNCPLCNLTSDPYIRRSKAEAVGSVHRHKRHDDLHPQGESILVEAFRLPGRGELKPALIVLVLVLAGLVSKFL